MTDSVSSDSPSIGDGGRVSYPTTPGPLPLKVASVSAQQRFERCPYDYWAGRALPREVQPPPTDAQAMGSRVHQWIEDWLNGEDPSYLEFQRLGRDEPAPAWADEAEEMVRRLVDKFEPPDGVGYVEKRRAFGLNDAGEAGILPYSVSEEHDEPHEKAVWRGILDYVVWDRATKTVTVIDWKTSKWQLDRDKGDGKVPLDRKRLPKDLQLRRYLTAAMIDYPEAVNYVVGHWYLRTGEWVSATISSSARKHLPALIEEASEANRALRGACESGTFPATPHTQFGGCEKCPWGPYFDGLDICPNYRDQATAVEMMTAAAGPEAESESKPESEQEPKPEHKQETEAAVSTDPKPASSSPSPRPAASPGWVVAGEQRRRLKVFLYGPEGTLKTRTGLSLFGKPEGALSGTPQLAVIDTEDGASLYGGEFLFYHQPTQDPDRVRELLDDLPRGVDAVMIDSFSLYCEAVMAKWSNLFLKRETSSAGNKRDYYTLQPRDYVHPNREITDTIKRLLKADLDVIVTAQAKPEYDNSSEKVMKRIGTTFDAQKRTAYYFDVVLFLDHGKDGSIVAETRKDRTNNLPRGVWEYTPERLAALLKGDQPAAAGADGLAAAETKTSSSSPAALGVGAAAPPPAPAASRLGPTPDQAARLRALKADRPTVYTALRRKHLGDRTPADLTSDEIDAWIADLTDPQIPI